MSKAETHWLNLQKGIEVPSHGVFVPWLLTKAELFQLIPASEFTISEGGCWPMLRFKLLGFSAVWGFNFVTHPSELLTELQFRSDRPHSPKRTHRRSSAQLLTWLGRPNIVDHSYWGQQTWHVGNIRVNNYIVHGTRFPVGAKVPVHTTSIHREGRA